MKISNVASIVNQKIDGCLLNNHTYISTECMLPNCGGIENSSSIPNGKATRFCVDDILLSNIRPYFKKVWFANFEGGCSNDVICLRATSPKCSFKYLYYAICTDKFIDTFSASSKGTKMPRGDKNALLSYEIPDRSIDEQLYIVDILGSVDNSIEKSEQIISEIERLIHLQFSVFYGGLTTKSTIGKEFECCLGGTPKTTCPEYWDGNINWINSGEVNKLRICNASKKISQLGMEKSATKLLNRGTTVIAITGATLGQVSLLEIDTCANQSVIGISENQIKKDFIYPLIMHHISDLIKKQTGGAQQHINMNDVKSLEIMVPTLTQYRDYSFEVMPLFDLQSSLCAKIEKMKELKALYLKKVLWIDHRRTDIYISLR